MIRIASASMVAVALCTVGCSAARMALPTGLDASAAYDVTGVSPRRSGDAVAFGPYTARMLQDGATFAWAVPVGGADVGRASRRYAFTLESAGSAPIEVSCLNRAWTLGRGDAQRLTVDVTGVAGPLLACEARASDGATARIEAHRRGRDLTGEATLPGTALHLRSTASLEGSPISIDRPAGYVLENGGRAWMAVDVLDRGRVHIAPAAPDGARAWLAATATALLLADAELE